MDYSPSKIKGPLKVAYNNIGEDILSDRMLIVASINRTEEIWEDTNISPQGKIHIITIINMRIRSLYQRIISSEDKKKIISCG